MGFQCSFTSLPRTGGGSFGKDSPSEVRCPLLQVPVCPSTLVSSRVSGSGTEEEETYEEDLGRGEVY